MQYRPVRPATPERGAAVPASRFTKAPARGIVRSSKIPANRGNRPAMKIAIIKGTAMKIANPAMEIAILKAPR
jgi:hypothetical protein